MSPNRQRKRINPRPAPQSPRTPSPVALSNRSPNSNSNSSSSSGNSNSISSSGGPPPARSVPQQPPGQQNQQRVRELEELEQRLQDLREELRRDIQSNSLSQNTAAKALYNIPPFKDNEFEVWVGAVGNAFHGAGILPLLKITSYRSDSEAPDNLRQAVQAYPDWLVGLAWSALTKTIGSDTTAYSRTLSIPTGDVKALLRSLRTYFEASSVPHQHRLLTLLRKTNMADYPDLKAYVAQLETIFARLAKIGHVVTDADKRYHLMEGLTEDFRRGVAGSIYTYEGPLGQPADYSKALQFLSIYDDNNLAAPKKYQREAAMATFTATTTRPVLCKNFSKGICRWGEKCKFRHVDAPGRHTHIAKRQKQTQGHNGGQPTFRRQHQLRQHQQNVRAKPKEMRCWRCGSPTHKKFNCRAKLDRVHNVVDATCDAPDPVLEGIRADQDQGWICQEEPVSVSVQNSTNKQRGEDQALGVDYAYPCGTTHSLSVWDWLLDGGSTCFVCAYPSEYSPYLFNRRPVDLTLVVGGQHRLECKEVADMVASFVGRFTGIRLGKGASGR